MLLTDEQIERQEKKLKKLLAKIKTRRGKKNIDLKLVDWVIKHAEEDPRRFDMTVWAERTPIDEIDKYSPPCGTACCFAGWGVFKGAKQLWNSSFVMTKDDEDRKRKWFRLTDEGSKAIREAGRKLFGFTEDEAHALFLDTRTLNGVKTQLNEIFKARGIEKRYATEFDK